MALVRGDIVDGKYRVVRLLGQGGMGAVYQGENVRTGDPVAIKVMHASLAREATLVARFEREAQAAARVGSRHVVEVLEVGDLPTRERFMVMEFLEGESLSTRLKREKRLEPRWLAWTAIQLLEGLAKVHEAGILHRDLKPGNLFLVRAASGGDFVKILDFGICKFVDDVKRVEPMTDAGSLLGTPAYMAPEALEDAMQSLDPRSDLYSAGVILYRCATGKLPYPASNIVEMVAALRRGAIPIRRAAPDLDAGFAAIVDKATARKPEGRFQQASEFSDALRAWLDGDPLDFEPTEPKRAAAESRNVRQIFTPTEPTLPRGAPRKRKNTHEEVTAKRPPIAIPEEPMRERAPSMSIDVEFEEDDPETQPFSPDPCVPRKA